ncbi:hypothetical protein EIO_1539 [Ketogulonicigenium vulgare Y25]|uniref:Uncharacterized protein n=1 Tax=Ketogulonicigenium vulgare (strain WSH-001) TaxID=759362 RepID=F9Y633_KETVW|nr:hypothetical protein [Ketogulonicigenium vulgare]ADO42668.1 hypothetical protein EIO_1539 [Ketogulonicigenium vulgare Y25]AEM40858.1 hypothetical protein KVU_1019 [Ketogulonicigenium vulgare WSH-001]ALJ81019.1 hypothetical protein KVH_07390 [Ketogulonicigenium vulgare]ANW35024.1 hypothetical protein KvSKV_07355 [Ketogulonicigenium vulgare]AOZ54577.1 hypothetical protein KVC_1563 [Ketogulonicigenium vulgare]
MVSPASNAASITPSPQMICRMSRVRSMRLGQGNVRVTMRDGGDPVVLPILAGSPAGCA